MSTHPCKPQITEEEMTEYKAMINAKAHHAIVLQVGDRYFCKYAKKRVTTAWCLAGAQMFRDDVPERIERIEKVLKEKGYKSVRKVISVIA